MGRHPLAARARRGGATAAAELRDRVRLTAPRVALIGGLAPAPRRPLGDHWTWDGARWSEVASVPGAAVAEESCEAGERRGQRAAALLRRRERAGAAGEPNSVGLLSTLGAVREGVAIGIRELVSRLYHRFGDLVELHVVFLDGCSADP